MNHHHHHHHVVPQARISLTLSRHFSLSFIASGKSSGLHPITSHSRCMYVRAGCPAFAQPYVGVHWSTSLMSSSLLLQQCPVCLVRLTWIVFVMGGRWPYSWCLVGCFRQDSFNPIMLNNVYPLIWWWPLTKLKLRKQTTQPIHLWWWTDKMKRSFFQAAVTSILLYGCNTWTLTKRLEKKLDGNYTRMLRAILNKSWEQL